MIPALWKIIELELEYMFLFFLMEVKELKKQK